MDRLIEASIMLTIIAIMSLITTPIDGILDVLRHDRPPGFRVVHFVVHMTAGAVVALAMVELGWI